ncbi:MAG: isovaleryl-CoA dehydrogenase [Hyphomicrobiaceae bacterium]
MTAKIEQEDPSMVANRFETHEVLNQSPAFEDVNLFVLDRPLQEAVKREAPSQSADPLVAFGAACGSAEAFARGRLANAYPPRLATFDRKGHRLDVVEYHPAYHECMAMSVAAGLHCSAWDHLRKPSGTAIAGANVVRAARLYLAAQMEPGHCCPLTMTNAAVPTLMLAPELAERWLPLILSRDYDPSFRPPELKRSLTIGMGMTEKQGGTDVRANATTARPVDGGKASGEHLLVGHKWFMSAPMSDAFLMLAQAPGGLSCFLVPRFLPGGGANGLRFQRLKDKLGNRSNASSEVELADAHGWLVGEEGRGVNAIIEMVTATRLDCAISSAGLMRLALAEAVHHARHRTVFQKRLVDQPLMLQVLADLALDVEAATALAFRLARAFDGGGDPTQQAWRRLMTPITKYWVCKIAPALIYEAMECLGGNGYVEESILPRLYREAPVNAIWEGSGNVMCLDVLRVLQREPEVAELIVNELQTTSEGEPILEAHLERVLAILHEPRLIDIRARALVEGLALAAAGALLRAHAPAAVADAFLATRLSGAFRQTYGQGLDRGDPEAVLARVLP